MSCRKKKKVYICITLEKRTGRKTKEVLKKGGVVQLVRMPACHAGGREFESRRHRLVSQTKDRQMMKRSVAQMVTLLFCFV